MTARFSNGGADPAIPDYAREARGLSVKFYLPDGGKTDILAITLPCFMVRTPEDFLSFTQARQDPEKLMPDWLGAHPEALPAIQAALSAQPPVSYATCTYNSIHSVPHDRRRRGLALRPLPLGARGRRADAFRRGRQGARARLPPRGDPGARRERLPAAGDRRDRGGRGGRPDGGMARGARARRGGPPGPRRPRPRARARRRHPRVRSHSRDRRNRAVGRRGPAVPPPRPTRCRWSAGPSRGPAG